MSGTRSFLLGLTVLFLADAKFAFEGAVPDAADLLSSATATQEEDADFFLHTGDVVYPAGGFPAAVAGGSAPSSG